MTAKEFIMNRLHIESTQTIVTNPLKLEKLFIEFAIMHKNRALEHVYYDVDEYIDEPLYEVVINSYPDEMIK